MKTVNLMSSPKLMFLGPGRTGRLKDRGTDLREEEQEGGRRMRLPRRLRVKSRSSGKVEFALKEMETECWAVIDAPPWASRKAGEPQQPTSPVGEER